MNNLDLWYSIDSVARYSVLLPLGNEETGVITFGGLPPSNVFFSGLLSANCCKRHMAMNDLSDLSKLNGVIVKVSNKKQANEKLDVIKESLQ